MIFLGIMNFKAKNCCCELFGHFSLRFDAEKIMQSEDEVNFQRSVEIVNQ